MNDPDIEAKRVAVASVIPADIKQILEAEMAKRAKQPQSPADFAMKASGGRWRLAPHLAALNKKLILLAEGRLKRLIVTCPPRHGKSEFCSKYFPAWYIGRYPDNRVILCSYQAEFAATWGEKARDLLDVFGAPMFGVRVKDDARARDDWRVVGRDGGMVTAGVGGAITGKGANCVVGSTLVATEVGEIAIDKLVDMYPIPRVLSFNHNTRRTEWRRVLATRKVETNEIYEIETVGGRRIWATGEHHFFLPERGYRKASDLSRGQRLVACEVPLKQKLRDMPRGEEGSRSNVPRLLLQGEKVHHNTQMRNVWSGIQKALVRIRKMLSKDGSSQFLLQSPLLSKAPCRVQCKEVQAVRKAESRESRPLLLLGSMQVRSQGGNDCEAGPSHCLPHMRRRISGEIQPEAVLRFGVRQQGSFQTDDRHGKFAFQGGGKLLKTVSRNASPYYGSRRSGMQDVREAGRLGRIFSGRQESLSNQYGDSPHQRRPYGQSTGKFDYVVRDVPCGTPQVHGDVVLLARRICGERHAVFDIQVEGNSNFFANSILVHNCLIIDDPVKNAEEASSKTMRDKVKDWWDSTAKTRLEPDGSVLIIQTRWHMDDLAGKLIAEQNDPDEPPDENWDLFNMPAMAESEDAIGRKPGEALWPERYNEVQLKRIKRRMSPYLWSALYQQRPLPAGGEIFNRANFRYYETIAINGLPVLYKMFNADGKSWTVKANECQKFVCVDSASSEKETADYTVAQVWAVTPAYDMLLIDCWRERARTSKVRENIVRLYRQWECEFCVIEKNTVGLPLLQSLRDGGLSVQSVFAHLDKVVRATAAEMRFGGEMIHFPKICTFQRDLAALIEELESFPKGVHDDCVDTLCWAAHIVNRLGGPVRDRVDTEYHQKQIENQQEAEIREASPGGKITGVVAIDSEESDAEWLATG